MEQILCPIAEQAQQCPDRIALIGDSWSLTYQELHQAINALAKTLSDQGIQPNARIAFIAKPNRSTILLFFALFRLHAIACPLSPRTPPEQIPTHLEQLKTTHFFNPEEFSSDEGNEYSTVSLDSPATFLFTSGSTGFPKIVCNSFANHYYNAKGVLSALKLTDSSRWLLSLPLNHVSGISILFRCFLSAATVVLSENSLVDAIKTHAITHISLVPTQLQRLLPEKFPTLQCILLGGAPIAPSLLEQAFYLPIFTTYGMTEMASMITLSSEQFLPHRELKIAGDSEIWVKGKTLFLGYWNPKHEKIDKLQSEWFPTKDLGKFNKDEKLEIVGRKDRLFISGGENIHPEEIEKALCAIPGIQTAVVLPIKDLEFGHRPVAFVKDSTGMHNLISIKEALKPLLPGFKHPVQILPLPDTGGLKPNLSALKDLIISLETESKG